MKEVKVYEAFDGNRFDTMTECLDYEEHMKILTEKVIPNFRGKKHSDKDAVQQVKSKIDSAWKSFIDACCEQPAMQRFVSVFRERESYQNCGETHIYRILSDFSHDYPLLWDIFFRFTCISEEGCVEYPQPYYAKHPEDWEGTIK